MVNPDRSARTGVDLWAIWLEVDPAIRSHYRGLLSAEEIACADRFAFDALRASYEVSHGALRLLLAQYVNCSPRDVGLTIGANGKPALRDDSGLRFNMSHSGRLAVYAIARCCEVGVDVEEIRAIADLEGVARRFFSPAEATELMSISEEKQRRSAFFRCWTCKESYIKAIGQGLSIGLDQFQVGLLPDSPPRFIHIGNDTREASAWTLQHFEPAAGYLGALAYRGAARGLNLFPTRNARDLLNFPTVTANRLRARGRA